MIDLLTKLTSQVFIESYYVQEAVGDPDKFKGRPLHFGQVSQIWLLMGCQPLRKDFMQLCLNTEDLIN